MFYDLVLEHVKIAFIPGVNGVVGVVGVVSGAVKWSLEQLLWQDRPKPL